MKCKGHASGPPDTAGRVRGFDADGSAPHRVTRDTLSGCGDGGLAFLVCRNRQEVPRLPGYLVQSENVQCVTMNHLHQLIDGHTGQRGPLKQVIDMRDRIDGLLWGRNREVAAEQELVQYRPFGSQAQGGPVRPRPIVEGRDVRPDIGVLADDG